LSKDDAGFEDQEENTKMDIDVEPKAEWKLDIPFGTDSERERWHSGEMAEVYADTLRTLLRLQGEEGPETEAEAEGGDDDKGTKAISTTIATAERAERAVEFVEKM
jgi:kinetochor protein Mis14/NSL1